LAGSSFLEQGYTFGESRTFTRYLGIAYGSAVETGELLRLAVEAGVVPGEEVTALLERTGEAERILLGMLKRRRNFAK
jgi:four helix bundle protein